MYITQQGADTYIFHLYITEKHCLIFLFLTVFKYERQQITK